MRNKKTIITVGLLITLIFVPLALMGGIRDRGDGTHNVGQLGFFATNIGQFYPWGGSFEQTLEYPINSGHIAMYRQCIMIGNKFPNGDMNVVSAASGRYEEWEPVHGYHAGNFKIAMSDKPETWPRDAEYNPFWPVRDQDNNPVVLSQQDSYCVYTDSASWRYAQNGETDMLLDLWVQQTIYSWGVPDANRFVIIKFEVENHGDRDLYDVYFNFYSDLDVGGISSGEEWADDCIGFDKSRELVYFYDADNYSDEWQEPDPFMPGVTFLKTPETVNGEGITDWHWIDVTIDEVAVNSTHWDSLHYALMASDTTWFHENDTVSHYFHLGAEPLNGVHYDDPQTTRIMQGDTLVGGPMVAYIVNGPVDLAAGNTVEYWVGLGVGENYDDLIDVIDGLRGYYANYEETGSFKIPVLPLPQLSARAGNQQVNLAWSDSLDIYYQNEFLPQPVNDLVGYIIYRTTDPFLQEWTAIDTIAMQYKDKADSTINHDAYGYIDSLNVHNGFTHYYNLCVYRHNEFGVLEESIKLADVNNVNSQSNAAEVNPISQPADSKADLDQIRVVPNPYIISAPWDRKRLGGTVYGEPIRNIAFTNLPTPCTIKIFTLDGDLLKTLEHTNNTGRKEWNLLTKERRPIVSGIYFYHVDSPLGETVGRFAVIR